MKRWLVFFRRVDSFSGFFQVNFSVGFGLCFTVSLSRIDLYCTIISTRHLTRLGYAIIPSFTSYLYIRVSVYFPD